LKKPPPFLQTNWLLSDFGRNKKQAKRSYQDFVEKEAAKAVENPYKQVTEGFLLGDGEFVKWVKETFLSGRNDEKEIPQLKKLAEMTKKRFLN
jgi:hypothetical protein